LQRHRVLFVGTQAVDLSQLPAGVRVLTPSSRWSALLMKGLRRIPGDVLRSLQDEGPVLMHAQFGTDGVWCAPLARKLQLPLLVSFRGFDITRREASSVPYWMYSRLRPEVYRLAHTVIAVCHYLKDKLVENGCPADKIEVIYNGIDPAEFTADAAVERADAVLFVGRLVEKKGVDTLVRAMSLVQKHRRTAKLVVIGDGPEQGRIESMARADGVALELLGRQHASVVRGWMNRARVFCLPSRTASSGDAEGLPNVILESQSMGLPVVSTRHAGIAEAVSDGATGLLVAEDDAAALADRILMLFADAALWQRLAGAARRNVETAFDSRIHVARLETLYERASRARAPRT
jgi:glycosyltransferase involved in cell wall biosynthesis